MSLTPKKGPTWEEILGKVKEISQRAKDPEELKKINAAMKRLHGAGTHPDKLDD